MVNDIEWLDAQLAQHGVLESAYVLANGISHERIQTLISEGQLHRLSVSLYAKQRHPVRWPSIVSAIQNQKGIPVRLSGVTSLKLHQRVKASLKPNEKIQLVSNQFEKLPKWAHAQNVALVNKVSRVFKRMPSVYCTEIEIEGMKLKASCPELAILEYLEQVTDESRFAAALSLLKGIDELDIEQMQELLNVCESEKAKRLFIHLAQQTGKPWGSAFDGSKVTLSEEVVTVIQGGIVDKALRITVPAFYPA